MQQKDSISIPEKPPLGPEGARKSAGAASLHRFSARAMRGWRGIRLWWRCRRSFVRVLEADAALIDRCRDRLNKLDHDLAEKTAALDAIVEDARAKERRHSELARAFPGLYRHRRQRPSTPNIDAGERP